MSARKRTGSAPLSDVRRTKASTIWVFTGIAVVLLLLLAIFIAQNGQQVEVHFLGGDGTVSLALGLLFSALAGAGIVLLAGAVRVVQLRLAGRRHMRSHAVAARTAEGTSSAPAGGVAEPVEPQRDADDTRP
jgi:uncharacterized integral membrane protein